MKLKDKVALVTGAASGLGKAIATIFLREGARVAVADLNLKQAQAVAAELGPNALAVGMDVTNEAHVEEGFAKTVERFGGLDIAVSNAGIQHLDRIVDLSYENWRKVVAVHLDAAFLVTRAAMRRMIRQERGGVLLYMGSVHSKVASPLKAPYTAAKHGILGLARTAAKEGAEHGIRVNVICPGFVLTPLVRQQIPQLAKEQGISEEEVARKIFLKDTVDGEFTTEEEVAEAALFLAAFSTNALTGQSLIVSHGWHME
ncbi:3-hydroxybutyrate dehydrogenase [Pelomicrobium sp. G1]|uniref:3-hydroxybutyrate dehydrogenase n=1 Tax=unclassified Pelomicrobium TaxID=2815318 RepID=UPI003F7712A6